MIISCLHGIQRFALDNCQNRERIEFAIYFSSEIFPASHRDKIIEFWLLALHREQRLNNLVGILMVISCLEQRKN